MKDANDKKTDSYFERKLIIGLIKSKEFIEQIQPLLKIKWLKNEESKRIAAWCIRYFKKYNEAPNEAIQDIYMKEAEKLKDETAALIEETLFSLSDEFESDEFDTDHFLDICEEYLKRRQIEYKIEDIKVSLDSNNLEDAISSIEQY